MLTRACRGPCLPRPPRLRSYYDVTFQAAVVTSVTISHASSAHIVAGVGSVEMTVAGSLGAGAYIAIVGGVNCEGEDMFAAAVTLAALPSLSAAASVYVGW